MNYQHPGHERTHHIARSVPLLITAPWRCVRIASHLRYRHPRSNAVRADLVGAGHDDWGDLKGVQTPLPPHPPFGRDALPFPYIQIWPNGQRVFKKHPCHVYIDRAPKIFCNFLKCPRRHSDGAVI